MFRCRQTPPAGYNRAGAPSWQQRALDHSFKDITACRWDNVRLARSATVDLVGTTQLGDALASSAKIEPYGRASSNDQNLWMTLGEAA